MRKKRTIDKQDMTEESYDRAFSSFIEEIRPLFDDMSGYLLVTLRDMYREHLKEAGVESASIYRSCQLKRRLDDFYGSKIVFLPQTNGSDFVCSSAVNIGDVLSKLQSLQESCRKPDEHDTLMEAARILRQKGKECKLTMTAKPFDISSHAALEIVPDSILNFLCQLFVDKKLTKNYKAECSEDIKESALLSQQLCIQYAICIRYNHIFPTIS